ncbi:ADAMTS-like protein 5 [Galemys pyrenaicus]|uniref:ADAMTS-like protein 5 n=1 Tax=Galemys pyrenaicus TaxID=202257 RepID=A0A8J6B2S2_GALPY|nr:ADAMTS-like protein 5 [Galemys pyrenaicus]
MLPLARVPPGEPGRASWAFRSRFSEEESCWGDSHEYRLCQLLDCPPGAVPFRDLQCALYNRHPLLGTQKTYQWIPFYGAPNQCDLNCLAEGHAFYHSFGRVLDGTPCDPDTQRLCVAGRCLSAGCDGFLGSDAREDRCGRCGGANDSCLLVQRVFRDAGDRPPPPARPQPALWRAAGADGKSCTTTGPDSLLPLHPGAFAGYWNVTLIPEGARHLRVTQQSRNHLALMGVDGSYVLNGNWAISPPGTYEAAGTHVVYTRDQSSQEMLSAVGPTSQNLFLQVLRPLKGQGGGGGWGWKIKVEAGDKGAEPLGSSPAPWCATSLQVLLREPNPGIQFEFWLPRELYSPFQAQTQALGWSLLQPQSQEVEPQPLVTPTVPAAIHPRTTIAAPVFRAQVLGHLRQAQETRYEVRVQLVYKNRSPLRAREYLWAPGRCPCPLLALHHEYLLAAQRLVSPDGSQDRLLLPHAGYGRPWTPAEDSRIRLIAGHCPA